MKKATKWLAVTALSAMLALPITANAASDEQAPAPEPAKPSNVRLDTAGAYTSLQVGNQVYVFNEQGQQFQTKGVEQVGSLKDLFVIKYGPQDVPLILVQNKKNGLVVFSDLWPKLNDEKIAENTIDAYDSGRVFYTAQNKIVSKTSHHYAEQVKDEVVVHTANDFDDLKQGYHESIRVKGKLRGLILFDCCPYVVVENANGELAVYHAGEEGAELSGTIDL